MSVLTDIRVDGGLVEGLDERLLRRPSSRVQLEVASDEELAGHCVFVVQWECEVGGGWQGWGTREGNEMAGHGLGGSIALSDDRTDATRRISPHLYLILSWRLLLSIA